MIALAFAALALVQSAPDMDTDAAALAGAIAREDARVFQVMFERCEPDVLADLVTEDFEFYHDRGGAMIGRDAFVDDYRRACEGRAAPDAWRSRRELTPGSMQVHPIPGYGAVSEGAHVFHERRGDGPERLAGRARFSILWQHEDGRWRMARVFSIDHAAAE